MGTNFYWRTESQLLPTDETFSIDSDDPRIHIGKRSAAGLYCWDCDETLNKEGRDRIHYGPADRYWPSGRRNIMDISAMVQAHKNAVYDRCPKCGQPPKLQDHLNEGPAAVELGFAKPAVQRPAGVQGASSFSWAQDPERVAVICERRPDEQIIVDEYGRALTGREFLDMLRANCPIQFTDAIGVAFS